MEAASTIKPRIHRKRNSRPRKSKRAKIKRALDEGSLFLLLRRLTSRSNKNRFVRDTHRKSGVLSFVALLSPVDSCNPPELNELTPCLYARGMRGASEKSGKDVCGLMSPVLSGLSCGFLESSG